MVKCFSLPNVYINRFLNWWVFWWSKTIFIFFSLMVTRSIKQIQGKLMMELLNTCPETLILVSWSSFKSNIMYIRMQRWVSITVGLILFSFTVKFLKWLLIRDNKSTYYKFWCILLLTLQATYIFEFYFLSSVATIIFLFVLGCTSRRSDLEVLAFNMYHWFTGQIPWAKVLTE